MCKCISLSGHYLILSLSIITIIIVIHNLITVVININCYYQWLFLLKHTIYIKLPLGCSSVML